MTDLLERVVPRTGPGRQTRTQLAGARVRRLAVRVSGWLPQRPTPVPPGGAARARPASAPVRLAPGASAGLAAVAASLALVPALPGRWGLASPLAALATVCVLLVVAAGARTARRAAITAPVATVLVTVTIILIGPRVVGVQPLTGAGWFGVGWVGAGGFGHGWRDLAAGPLPQAPTHHALTAVVVTSVLAAALAVAVGVQPGTGLLALAPAVTVLLAAASIGAANRGAAVVVVASVAVHLLVASGTRLVWWRAGSALLVLAVAAGVAVPVSGALVPEPAPTAAIPPTRPLETRSPLAWVSAWQNASGTPVFTVDQVPGPLRWVSLDEYDTTTWTTTGRYRLAGATLDVQAPDTPTRAVRTQVSGLTLPGPWLVSPGRPTALDGAAPDGSGLLIDAAGDLATAAGAPARYGVTGVVATPSEASLRGVRQRQRTADEVGAVADEVISARAEQATADTATDLDRLAALADWSRTNLRYDPKALPGQSLRTLSQVSAGTRGGTMDQIAGSYALMARSLGYPSRVVVGFTPADAGAVSSSDVVAWPEVWLDGIGWQPFYPVPLRGVRTEHDITWVASAQPLPPAATPDPAPVAEHPGGAPATAAPEDGDRWYVPAAAAALIAALGLGLVRRRRVRTGGTPSDRVLRAWIAVQRTLSRRGVRQVRTLTADEVVERVRRRWGAEQARRVGQLADLATGVLFGGLTPSEQQARQAWQLVDQIRRSRRAAQPEPVSVPVLGPAPVEETR